MPGWLLEMTYKQYIKKQQKILKELKPYLVKAQRFLQKSNGFPKEKLAFDDENTYVPCAWINGNKEVKPLEIYKPHLIGKPEIISFLNLDWNNGISLEDFVKLDHTVYFSLNGATEYIINSLFLPKIKRNQKVTPKEIFEHAFYANSVLNLKENCDCVCSLLKVMLEIHHT